MSDSGPPKRASLFGNTGAAPFQPKPRPEPRPSPEEIDRLSSDSKFSRKEAAAVDETVQESPLPVYGASAVRKPMIYRTGRNATLSVKTTQDTIALFYAVAEQKGWKAGETFEKAIALLAKQEKLRKSGTISENERTS